MPYAPTSGGRLFYREAGSGPAVIATHGFSETHTYWWAGGVADRLASQLRFIAIDMRGHGQTQTEGGCEISTMADDVAVLADHLGLDHYMVLGHATGSVVALRHAMANPPRLTSIAVTSAASATAMIEDPTFFENMGRFYATKGWDEIIPRIQAKPWPFLHWLDRHPDREALWSAIEGVFRANDPKRLSAFVGSFYTDNDPYIERLQKISVPTLIIDAEGDETMRAPSALLRAEIPGACYIDLAGVGHMTALEAPGELAAHLLNFFTTQERQL